MKQIYKRDMRLTSSRLTKFRVVCRTRTTTATFILIFCNFFSDLMIDVSQIQFYNTFDSDKQSN